MTDPCRDRLGGATPRARRPGVTQPVRDVDVDAAAGRDDRAGGVDTASLARIELPTHPIEL